MDVVTKVENTPTHPGDKPKTEVVIADCEEIEVAEEGERIEL